MLHSYFSGLMLGAGLIIAIGAQNAFLLTQGVRREYHIQVAAICALCDAILICIGVFGLAALLVESPQLIAVARWGGAAFLTWYGIQALVRALRPVGLQNRKTEKARSMAKVLLMALAVTLLNPHVYLDTVLLVGSLGAQQTEPGAYALGAVSASITWFFGLALGAAWLSPWLARPTVWRFIDFGIAAMMLTIAAGLILK
ncbi:LysE/ArgO family amino acid transporter [Microbulbifer sp. CAU 1566]|uniref:LysE/ArgO family amino acid transporter n=1 Tax=Microbulbifer sp. CAU 1566 TaxID=2933269 RepID=UPI00200399BD|nr:LysE/ArgO family amino acid transporter [Microbulbifer sp. CAU 1566]MCK7598095.1 LysE/ArgO family amino acid transporter [Microbulbifer sp. CAU 1566]